MTPALSVFAGGGRLFRRGAADGLTGPGLRDARSRQPYLAARTQGLRHQPDPLLPGRCHFYESEVGPTHLHAHPLCNWPDTCVFGSRRAWRRPSAPRTTRWRHGAACCTCARAPSGGRRVAVRMCVTSPSTWSSTTRVGRLYFLTLQTPLVESEFVIPERHWVGKEHCAVPRRTEVHVNWYGESETC